MTRPDAYSRTGRGPWRETVKGFNRALHLYDPDRPETLHQSRDAMVAALKESAWYQRNEEYDELWQAVNDLETSETVDWIDDALAQIYDLADDDRVWLGLGGED